MTRRGAELDREIELAREIVTQSRERRPFTL